MVLVALNNYNLILTVAKKNKHKIAISGRSRPPTGLKQHLAFSTPTTPLISSTVIDLSLIFYRSMSKQFAIFSTRYINLWKFFYYFIWVIVRTVKTTDDVFGITSLVTYEKNWVFAQIAIDIFKAYIWLRRQPKKLFYGCSHS